MTTYAVVGRPVTRQEGPDKVSGTFLYSADVALPGMVWGKVLRSPFPHARIVNIDATRALSLAGVRAVITGKDTAGMRVGRMVRDVPLLAEDTVRFVGGKGGRRRRRRSRHGRRSPHAHRRGIRASSGHLRPSGSDGARSPLVTRLAHLASASGPIQPHEEYPAPRHLVWRPGARLPSRTGFSSIPLPPPGCTRATWSPMPAWWLSTPPGAYRCGPTTRSALHVAAQAARRRAGVL